MGCVTERVEYRGHVVVNGIGQLEHVKGGNGDVFGKRAGAVHADADGIHTKVSAPGTTVTADAAGNMTLGRNPVADFEASDLTADVDDFATKLVADGHRDRNSLAAPSHPT